MSGRGCLDLTLGDFARGWEGYEARWVDGKSIGEALGVRYPLWRGPSAPPQRVLVIKRGQIGGEIPREHLGNLELMSEYTGVHG